MAFSRVISDTKRHVITTEPMASQRFLMCLLRFSLCLFLSLCFSALLSISFCPSLFLSLSLSLYVSLSRVVGVCFFPRKQEDFEETCLHRRRRKTHKNPSLQMRLGNCVKCGHQCKIVQKTPTK